MTRVVVVHLKSYLAYSITCFYSRSDLVLAKKSYLALPKWLHDKIDFATHLEQKKTKESSTLKKIRCRILKST